VAQAEINFTVEEDPEGGFVAEALGHAIVTQGDTMEELRRMVQDAVGCHFEPEERPGAIRPHIVKQEVLPV
jgi:predicted RNase H-like HicB family nuclease